MDSGNGQTAAILRTVNGSAGSVGSNVVMVPGTVEGQMAVVSPSNDYRLVKEAFYGLLARTTGPTESALGILSILQRVSNSSIEEFLHELHAPSHIAGVFKHLYEDARKFLFSIVARTNSEEAESAPSAPVSLWLQELEFLLTWIEKRKALLNQTSEYRLGEEGFFNLRVLVDTEKNQNFGVTVCGSLNLDSRGDHNQFLQVKILSGGMPLMATDAFGSWREESTGHFFVEQPLVTKGAKKIGRIIVDDIGLFVPYEALAWRESQTLPKKTAEVVFLLTVIDRQGEIICSDRVPTVIRVLSHSSDTNGTSGANVLQSPQSIGFFEKCPLKGNAIEDASAQLVGDEIKINASVLLFSAARKDVQLDIRVLDGEGGALHEEFYTLRPVTNIARFDEVGSSIPLTGLNLHPEAELMPEQIEILVSQEDGKILCGTVLPITMP